MAPEQAPGLPTDHRSDIFSFGAILYEMLFGRRAFKGDTAAETMFAILKQDPLELAGTGRALPPDVSASCGAASRRAGTSASSRPVTWPSTSRPSPGPSTRRRRTGAQGTRRHGGAGPGPRCCRCCWPLVSSGGMHGARRSARSRCGPSRSPRCPARSSILVFPDGNHVAFTWTGPKQDNPDIYVQQIGSGSPFRLTTDPRSDYNPVWSPDGRWIAFLRGESSRSRRGKSELRLIPPLGGPERKLAEIRVRGSLCHAAVPGLVSGQHCLVVTDSPGEGKPDALFVVSLETGEKRQLTNPQSPVLGDTNPAVSPDGRALVFRRNVALAAGELYWLPLGKGLTAGGEPKRLTPAALDADFPAWMPDGKEILFSARGSLWRLAISGENTPARIPFVGEDGSMPAVSRPQPGRPPGWSTFAASGTQYLARRDLCSRRAILVSAGRRDLLHESGV